MPTDPRIIFGKRVRELRLERHLSQEKLAELADLHRNYVGGVERGERNVSLINIVKLAHGLSDHWVRSWLDHDGVLGNNSILTSP